MLVTSTIVDYRAHEYGDGGNIAWNYSNYVHRYFPNFSKFQKPSRPSSAAVWRSWLRVRPKWSIESRPLGPPWQQFRSYRPSQWSIRRATLANSDTIVSPACRPWVHCKIEFITGESEPLASVACSSSYHPSASLFSAEGKETVPGRKHIYCQFWFALWSRAYKPSGWQRHLQPRHITLVLFLVTSHSIKLRKHFQMRFLR